ncbi:MAG: hypothetical protein ACUVR4_05705 [Anaerolineae bacterium]
MNIFNRIVVVLLLFALLALILTVAVFPLEAVTIAGNALTATGAFFQRAQAEAFWLFTVGRVLAVLLAVIVFGLLLWGELKPKRPKAVQVRTESGSRATVTTDSVARRLAWHIDQLADVITVTPEVTAAGHAVNVLLNLETRPEIDVPMKTDEVVAVAREVITERMGLQLGKIDVRIKHAPYQEGP